MIPVIAACGFGVAVLAQVQPSPIEFDLGLPRGFVESEFRCFHRCDLPFRVVLHVLAMGYSRTARLKLYNRFWSNRAGYYARVS